MTAWRPPRRHNRATFRELLLLAALAPGLAAAARTEPISDGRYAFALYGTDEGLANAAPECLLQDRTGFLWVGTEDGLFRFDGRRFVRYGREEGLPSTRINVLHEAPDGRLWVGTRGGLALKEGDRFVPQGSGAGLPETAVADGALASAPEGTLFVATERGLFSGAPGRFKAEAPPRGAEDPVASALYRAEDGALFVAYGPRLFRRAPSGAWEDFGATHALAPRERIDEVLADAQGTLWVRTLRDLYRLPRGAERFTSDGAGLPGGVDSGRLAADGAGALLVPTEEGLAWKEGERWRLLGLREGLPGEAVLSALVDREGTLWVGVAGMGLAQRLGEGAFASWGKLDGLSHDVVWAVARGRDGALWVGTQRGLDRIAPDGALRVFRVEDGLGGDAVFALAAGPDAVWAGSVPGGITRFGLDGSVRRMPVAGEDPTRLGVVALHVDADGTVWAGGSLGAYRLRKGESAFARVEVPGAAPGERDTVYALAEAGGTLFGAGRLGIQPLRGAVRERLRKANGLAADFVSALAALPDGRLVAGYREALGAAVLRVVGDRLGAPAPLAGLGMPKVLLLGVDRGGRLWAGGEGIDLLDGDGKRYAHFGRSDGLATEDMSQNAFLAEEDGTVWLGTSHGLVRYRPRAGAHAPVPPPVVLTGCWGGERALATDVPARLSYGERAFRVRWAALTFRDRPRVRFRYRLVGLEDTLVETAEGEARFPGLPPGHYRLEVSAVSAAGISSERPAAFSFEVAAPWWGTWWARAAAFLLAAAAATALVKRRTRALERDRERLEKAVAERSAALAAANDELREASVTDPLTEARNRRFFQGTIRDDLARSLRAGKDVLFFLLDIDRFKEVNDLHGHEAGDAVLVAIARRLAALARTSDLVVRWGGEEFLVVFRDADRAAAPQLAGRVLEAVGASPIALPDGQPLVRTTSIGWVAFPFVAESPELFGHEELLRLADRALYLAKRSGRNRAIGVVARGARSAGAKDALLTGPLADGELVALVETPGPG